MALKQLILQRKIEQGRASLSELLQKEPDFQKRADALEAAIGEAKTDEEVAAVEAEVDKLDGEKADLEEKKSKLEGEIAELEGQLEELNSKEPPVGPAASVPGGQNRNRVTEGGEVEMRRGFFKGMTRSDVDSFFAREEVKEFIDSIRSIKTRDITGGSLTVPEVMLELLRNNLEQYSKLAKYVSLKPVRGTARQNIMGTAPEGIWMEAEGELNELNMALNQVEVDGYMVGGFIPIHNNLLHDSDMALGSEIMDQLGKAIGKGVDRAILYGTGANMPLGIVTRLAQTSAPSDWGTDAPDWTDLHTSNIKKINIDGTTGATFYASLIAELGIAKPDYSNGQVFWVMNRKTHIKLMSKALAFDAAAALLAGVNNQMPIVGGTIEELEIVGDNEIIGGFGSVYLLAEREGSRVEGSEHVRFLKNQTVYKGYARYDGMPVFGEAFIQVSFDNTAAVTTSTFPLDTANPALGALAITSAAGSAKNDTNLGMTGGQTSGTFFGYIIADAAKDVKYGEYHTGYTPVTFTDGSATVTVGAANNNKYITVVEFYYGMAIAAGSKKLAVKTTD